jgi:CRISPR/Cas system-associated endonuclease Cas1
LRGIEGARIKESYQRVAERYGVTWHGRRFDRNNPSAADLPNQAINHAATFVEAAADIAVAATGAMPPLGFIHEESSNAFTLDIADLFRVEVALPLAFSTVKACKELGILKLEQELRRRAARAFRQEKLIPKMIGSRSCSMSMTVIATRNVEPKVRGFLASVMLEVGPGVYCAPRISPAVRDRIWSVMNYERLFHDQSRVQCRHALA